MRFLCLGYLDMNRFDAVPEAVKSEILKACFAQCEPFRATGKVVEEEGLQHTSRAKTIRPRKGKPMVTDGPFMEAKEQIGSSSSSRQQTSKKRCESPRSIPPHC